MPEKLRTLSEFTKPHMVLTCHCGRKGRYNVARLIEKHGPDMPIRDFIDLIGQSCPRWVRPSEHRSCGIGCDDLVYMFSPAPATEEYARKQAR
ncbi:hypothetical protein N181_25210 [Sinorhizobium fredii USDA 205]|uniref:Uncharacterized protein n=2 Tax=Sinorhizobium TaxID=28105 RepID=A0A844AC51_RHIFR|nr:MULTISPECIES: hypothetical protein [Sinorhizobium]KSV83679.1 hypothetical protein N181_25210 [Sinorhizobium fredii USDA 205]MQX10744.1 hypothetical protein [Sinorhizobium fredii]OAP40346.1 hypothetical protein AU381_00005 [Sinorhizobium glycinis]GEC33572.1 hypothetical protein EFR01_37430 [Sinorhizobium fredii]GLS11873.1 hypothetical protein GCM10007864_55050 [Sinorhizobium fredii]